jgi:hypothetical protein
MPWLVTRRQRRGRLLGPASARGHVWANANYIGGVYFRGRFNGYLDEQRITIGAWQANRASPHPVTEQAEIGLSIA